MKENYTVVYGLTADPIHKGHEQAIINGINYCHKHDLLIRKFILLPVFQPNLIDDKKRPVAAFTHRLAMCQVLAQRLSKVLKTKIEVSAVEKQLSETTATINTSFMTIQHLQKQNNSKQKYLFMVSADHFIGNQPKFKQWSHWQALVNICGLLINQRPNNKINAAFVEQLKTINSDIHCVNSPHQVDISSSQIRNSIQHYLGSEFISADISQYLTKNHLY